jgi:hypothetical protein
MASLYDSIPDAYLAPAPLERLEPARLDDEVTAEQAAAVDELLEALA